MRNHLNNKFKFHKRTGENKTEVVKINIFRFPDQQFSCEKLLLFQLKALDGLLVSAFVLIVACRLPYDLVMVVLQCSMALSLHTSPTHLYTS